MRSFGRPGDRWSLPRVCGAILTATLVGAALGWLVDLLIGPLIGQSGWWTVFAFSGTIAGATAQAVRELGQPSRGFVHGDDRYPDGRPSATRVADPSATDSPGAIRPDAEA